MHTCKKANIFSCRGNVDLLFKLLNLLTPTLSAMCINIVIVLQKPFGVVKCFSPFINRELNG